MTATEESPRERPLLPEPPGQQKWREAAIDYDIKQLQSIREAASKWSASVTALLGLFATVAVVAGTDKLSEVANPALKWLILGLVIVSGASASVAISYSSAAAGAGGKAGRAISNFNADTYRAWIDEATRDSANKLSDARRWGYIAVGGVFLVGVLSLLSAALPASPGSASSVVVVSDAGGVVCGPIVSSENIVTVGGNPIPTSVRQVVPVAKC